MEWQGVVNKFSSSCFSLLYVQLVPYLKVDNKRDRVDRVYRGKDGDPITWLIF